MATCTFTTIEPTFQLELTQAEAFKLSSLLAELPTAPGMVAPTFALELTQAEAFELRFLVATVSRMDDPLEDVWVVLSDAMDDVGIEATYQAYRNARANGC